VVKYEYTKKLNISNSYKERRREVPYEARQPSLSEKVPNHPKILSLKDERTV